MIPVLLKGKTYERMEGNPTLLSLDSTEKATLQTILVDSWTDEDRARFGVFLAEPFVVPEGKNTVGDPRYELSGGSVVEIFDVEDVPGPSADDVRRQEFELLADRTDLMDKLKTATPVQIDSWIDSNVTSLASARAVLKAIVKLLVSARFKSG